MFPFHIYHPKTIDLTNPLAAEDTYTCMQSLVWLGVLNVPHSKYVKLTYAKLNKTGQGIVIAFNSEKMLCYYWKCI